MALEAKIPFATVYVFFYFFNVFLFLITLGEKTQDNVNEVLMK